MDHGLRFTLSPARVLWLLGWVIGALVALHLLGKLSIYGFGHPKVYGLVPLFNMDDEHNIPTYFSTLLLFTAACLLWLIATAKRQAADAFSRYWWGLALIFLFLSIDEMSSIHELFTRPMRKRLETDGVLYFAWLVVYVPLVVLVGVLYLRFLLHLPARYKALFLASAGLYLGGAVLLEMLGGYYASRGADEFIIIYELIATTEETLEMSGISLFIYALLSYIAEHSGTGEVSIRLSGARPSQEMVGR